ncbi:MAG: ribosome biogenesis GTPase Der [Patescibacteria group bacterium]
MAKKPTIVHDAIPTVALVGRVNVGKSMLFNRIIEQRHALVSPQPGTTRTRNVAIAWWRGNPIRFIDTGGLTFDESIPLEKDVIRQTELALAEADIIAFVTDAQTGILPQERELARRLHKQNKTVILIANKADTQTKEMAIHDPVWRGLGFGEPIPASAQNGRNVGDLLDVIYAAVQSKYPAVPALETEPIRVAIIGKPNVGKSTLFNALIGEERVIVSPVPHTTREPHDTLVTWEDTPMQFIDTAGIRRPARMEAGLEKEGVQKSIHALTRADIALLVLDAGDDISVQDKRLASLIEESNVGIIIVVNKWDAVKNGSDAVVRTAAIKQIARVFPFALYAPVVLVSALEKRGVANIMPLIMNAQAARNRELTEDDLNAFFKEVIAKHRPPRGKGTAFPKLLGMKQRGVAPPIFELFIKQKTSLHRSYVSYLENRLRERFDFTGTPIVIRMRKRGI